MPALRVQIPQVQPPRAARASFYSHPAGALGAPRTGIHKAFRPCPSGATGSSSQSARTPGETRTFISPAGVRSSLIAGIAAVAAGAVGSRTRTVVARAASCPPYLSSAQKRCLLISNSKLAGLDYLEHVMDHIKAFLGEVPDGGAYVVFVPFAQRNRDGYASKFRAAFKETGYDVRSLHECVDANARLALVRGASAIFVGGGNTYRLLKCLQQDAELLPLIASRVASGELAYIGSSAGTNCACPTVRNTNDMPIVWPDSLDGLCFVPFQINTHYIDEDRELKNHMGETRATRLREFVEENDVPVLALREGASVLVEGESAKLLGPARISDEVTWDGARLVRRASDGGPLEIPVGASLDHLMALGGPGRDQS